MNPAQQVGDDLQYVRQAVARRDRPQHIPTGIAWMVAIYVAVGYTLLDIDTRWASIFFLVGGIAMGILVNMIARKFARSPCTGEASCWRSWA